MLALVGDDACKHTSPVRAWGQARLKQARGSCRNLPKLFRRQRGMFIVERQTREAPTAASAFVRHAFAALLRS